MNTSEYLTKLRFERHTASKHGNWVYKYIRKNMNISSVKASIATIRKQTSKFHSIILRT